MTQEKKRGDFTLVNNKIIKDESLKASDKSVYLVLSHFADNITGECFPSRNTLLKLSGMSDRTLRNAIKNLENAGYISVKSRYVSGGRATNSYKIL